MHKVQTLQLALQSTNQYIIDTGHDQWAIVSLLSACWCLDIAHLFLSSETESKAYAHAVLSPSDKPMWHFRNIDIQKTELATKDKSAAQKLMW